MAIAKHQAAKVTRRHGSIYQRYQRRNNHHMSLSQHQQRKSISGGKASASIWRRKIGKMKAASGEAKSENVAASGGMAKYRRWRAWRKKKKGKAAKIIASKQWHQHQRIKQAIIAYDAVAQRQHGGISCKRSIINSGSSNIAWRWRNAMALWQRQQHSVARRQRQQSKICEGKHQRKPAISPAATTYQRSISEAAKTQRGSRQQQHQKRWRQRYRRAISSISSERSAAAISEA